MLRVSEQGLGIGLGFRARSGRKKRAHMWPWLRKPGLDRSEQAAYAVLLCGWYGELTLSPCPQILNPNPEIPES